MNTKCFCMFGFLTLLSFCVLGCGNGQVGLSGKVTFSDDDSPLTVGMVCFSTDSFLARGAIQGDGTYTLGSASEKDGLPPGQYRVYVEGAVKEKEDGKNQGGGMSLPTMVTAIDPKFSAGKTSGIVADVTASTKTFDFKVDRAK